jgi:hypothetical protein
VVVGVRAGGARDEAQPHGVRAGQQRLHTIEIKTSVIAQTDGIRSLCN